DVVVVLDQAGVAHANLVNEARQVRHPAQQDLRASRILLHRCHSPLMFFWRVAPSGTLAERSCRCEESATRQPRPRLLRLRLAMTIRVAWRQDPRNSSIPIL